MSMNEKKIREITLYGNEVEEMGNHSLNSYLELIHRML